MYLVRSFVSKQLWVISAESHTNFLGTLLIRMFAWTCCWLRATWAYQCRSNDTLIKLQMRDLCGQVCYGMQIKSITTFYFNKMIATCRSLNMMCNNFVFPNWNIYLYVTTDKEMQKIDEKMIFLYNIYFLVRHICVSTRANQIMSPEFTSFGQLK